MNDREGETLTLAQSGDVGPTGDIVDALKQRLPELEHVPDPIAPSLEIHLERIAAVCAHAKRRAA